MPHSIWSARTKLVCFAFQLPFIVVILMNLKLPVDFINSQLQIKSKLIINLDRKPIDFVEICAPNGPTLLSLCVSSKLLEGTTKHKINWKTLTVYLHNRRLDIAFDETRSRFFSVTFSLGRLRKIGGSHFQRIKLLMNFNIKSFYFIYKIRCYSMFAFRKNALCRSFSDGYVWRCYFKNYSFIIVITAQSSRI